MVMVNLIFFTLLILPKSPGYYIFSRYSVVLFLLIHVDAMQLNESFIFCPQQQGAGIILIHYMLGAGTTCGEKIIMIVNKSDKIIPKQPD